MSAIDLINNMSNKELVKYYEYCMLGVYERLKIYGNICFHPTYEHCAVYVGYDKSNYYQLHLGNELTLLNIMWDRYMSGTFIEQCWWKSINPFKTKISIKQQEVNISKLETLICVKKNLRYDNQDLDLIGSGSKRDVFISKCKTFVIKIPQEPYKLGLEENKVEAEIYNNNKNSIYAKCELIENGWLKMEYVKPCYYNKGDNYPKWTLDIAEHQVGYNLNNKLVAYDYGSVK